MDPTDNDLAPRFRRAAAFVFDLLTTVVIAFVAVGVLGYFLPPDNASPFMICLIVGLLLGFVYLALAPKVFGGTLGKKMFSLAVVGTELGAPISTGRWIGRMLLGYCLWPISALMVLFGETRQHLGDKVANTNVVVSATPRHLLVGLAVGVIGGYILLKVGMFGMKVAVINTSAWEVAKSAVQGDDKPTLPSAYAIQNNIANFYFESGGDYYYMALARRDGKWHVAETEKISEDDVPTSVSIGFSASNDDAIRAEIERVIETKLVPEIGDGVSVRCPEGALVGMFECALEVADGNIPISVTRKGTDIDFDVKGLLIGKKLVVHLERLFNEQYEAELADVKCPELHKISGKDTIECSANYDGAALSILVEVKGDAEITDISFKDTLSANKLEEMAAKAWKDAGNGLVQFRCAKRLYITTSDQEIVCPSAGQDKLNAVFTTQGDKISVKVRTP